MGSPAAIVYVLFPYMTQLRAHIGLAQVKVLVSLGKCHVLDELRIVNAEPRSQDLPQSGQETPFIHSLVEYTHIVDA